VRMTTIAYSEASWCRRAVSRASAAGNSNTRWHWNSAEGAPEPLIPWDAWLFPDGTPISYTETGALRRYVTGVDPFISFSKFLTIPAIVEDGDAFLTLQPGDLWHAPMNGSRVSDLLLVQGCLALFTLHCPTVPGPTGWTRLGCSR
jgi:hypothetical protein